MPAWPAARPAAGNTSHRPAQDTARNNPATLSSRARCGQPLSHAIAHLARCKACVSPSPDAARGLRACLDGSGVTPLNKLSVAETAPYHGGGNEASATGRPTQTMHGTRTGRRRGTERAKDRVHYRSDPAGRRARPPGTPRATCSQSVTVAAARFSEQRQLS